MKRDADQTTGSAGGQREQRSRRSSARPRGSQPTKPIQLAASAELFRTPDGQAYATVPVDARRDTWPVKGAMFRQWVARQCFLTTGGAVRTPVLHNALSVLEAKALYSGSEQHVFTRVGKHGATLYLDLVNQDWQAVAIDAAGWRVVTTPPIKF